MNLANYFIKSDKPNKKFLVVEQASDLVMRNYTTYEEAKKLTKHLNNGGGFAGHTPPFMVKCV